MQMLYPSSDDAMDGENEECDEPGGRAKNQNAHPLSK